MQKSKEIEQYYEQCEAQGANEHQIEESQKAVAQMEAIIGDPDRLCAVARTLFTITKPVWLRVLRLRKGNVCLYEPQYRL